MQYINPQGIVIEALQWDGSEERKTEIEKKFGVVFERTYILKNGSWRTNAEKKDYFFVSPLTGYFTSLFYREFERHFTPITDARVAIFEQYKKDMKLEQIWESKKKDD